MHTQAGSRPAMHKRGDKTIRTLLAALDMALLAIFWLPAGFWDINASPLISGEENLSGGSFEGKMAVVTAYSSSLDETDEDPEIGASGKRMKLGMAACPRRYPFGTRIEVLGKVYICEDRLSKAYDERIDIWHPSKKEAIEFGIVKAKVKVFNSEPTGN